MNIGDRFAARVRCTVTQLHAGALWYRSAIAFDRPAAWLDSVTNGDMVNGKDELQTAWARSRVSTNYPGLGGRQADERDKHEWKSKNS